MKKLLILAFLLVYTYSFAQISNEKDSFVSKNNKQVSITSLAASPNPFNTSTTIRFTSTKNQQTLFTIKNLLGKTVFQITIDAKSGVNSFLFERNDLLKGMYVYSLQTNTEIISKRLVIR